MSRSGAADATQVSLVGSRSNLYAPAVMDAPQPIESAAPTLNSVILDRDEARELFDRVVLNLNLLLQNERIHGDLSAYKILYWEGDITLIDFPQVVDPEANQTAWNIFLRDVTRVCQYFATQGLKRDPRRLATDLWTSHGYKVVKDVHPGDLDPENKDDRRLWEKQKKSK